MKNLRLILSLIASLLVLAFVHGTPSIEQTSVPDVGVVVCPALDHHMMIDSVDYSYVAPSDVSEVYLIITVEQAQLCYSEAYRMYVHSESYRWPPSRYECVSADYYNRCSLEGLLPERIRYGLNMALPVVHQRPGMRHRPRRV